MSHRKRSKVLTILTVILSMLALGWAARGLQRLDRSEGCVTIFLYALILMAWMTLAFVLLNAILGL